MKELLQVKIDTLKDVIDLLEYPFSNVEDAIFNWKLEIEKLYKKLTTAKSIKNLITFIEEQAEQKGYETGFQSCYEDLDWQTPLEKAFNAARKLETYEPIIGTGVFPEQEITYLYDEYKDYEKTIEE